MTMISDNAAQILKKRFLKKGETWEALCRSVAETIANAEKDRGQRSKWFRRYYRMMQALDFLPNSPTLFNLRHKNGCGSACFVLPVEDNRDRIFKTLSDAVIVQTHGGGTGFDFSSISPRRQPPENQSSETFGPVAFIKIYDYTIGNLTRQSGIRRGANMGILRVDHPEIEDFIAAKKNEGRLQNFNLSVGVTDTFIKAVQKDDSFNLVFNNRIWKTVRARSLWQQIIESAWHNGEPGIIFLDTVNRTNPLQALGRVDATNPCGEQPLLPYGSCNLGSINLAQMVLGNWVDQPVRIDWEKLEATTQKAVRFLDAVITVNRYPVADIERMTLKTRQIGLGIMGFADLCIKLHIRYGSSASIHTAQELMQFIYDTADKTSVALGLEKGPAPVYQGLDLPSPPRRNASLTTVSPTGTISIIADCSSGCEPHYAFDYTKECLDGEQLAVTPAVMREWIAAKGPQPLPPYFVTALDVAMEEHIRIQAAFQNSGVDAAVSKTINAPYETMPEQVSDAFMLAWELGCKGITFYRPGSRRIQPVF